MTYSIIINEYTMTNSKERTLSTGSTNLQTNAINSITQSHKSVYDISVISNNNNNNNNGYNNNSNIIGYMFNIDVIGQFMISVKKLVLEKTGESIKVIDRGGVYIIEGIPDSDPRADKVQGYEEGDDDYDKDDLFSIDEIYGLYDDLVTGSQIDGTIFIKYSKEKYDLYIGSPKGVSFEIGLEKGNVIRYVNDHYNNIPHDCFLYKSTGRNNSMECYCVLGYNR